MIRTEINNLSDEELISLALKNHSRAISCLVDRYKGMVFTLSYRILKNHHDAEEVAQDCFVKAFKALNNFRFDSKFSTWLYQICYHTAISKTRAYKPVQVDLNAQSELFNESKNAIDNLLAKDRNKYLNKALSMLEPDESAILTLFYVEENSITDISKITDLTESNVKVKLYRGRKRLYTQLELLLKEEVALLL